MDLTLVPGCGPATNALIHHSRTIITPNCAAIAQGAAAVQRLRRASARPIAATVSGASTSPSRVMLSSYSIRAARRARSADAPPRKGAPCPAVSGGRSAPCARRQVARFNLLNRPAPRGYRSDSSICDATHALDGAEKRSTTGMLRKRTQGQRTGR
jgi:hypothetical protein